MFSAIEGEFGQVHQRGDDAVLALDEAQVDREHTRLVGIGRRERQLAGLPVKPLDLKVHVERAVGQGGGPGDRHFGGNAEDRLAQHDAVDVEFLDLDGDRQFGQAERLRLGVGHLLARDGQARQQHFLGRKLVDLDPPAQQRKTAPGEADVVERDPHAFGIGDGQLFDGRTRGQRAGKALDADLAALGREVVLEQRLQIAAVVLLGLRMHGLRDEQGRHDDDEEFQPGQNACPMPM